MVYPNSLFKLEGKRDLPVRRDLQVLLALMGPKGLRVILVHEVLLEHEVFKEFKDQLVLGDQLDPRVPQVLLDRKAIRVLPVILA